MPKGQEGISLWWQDPAVKLGLGKERRSPRLLPNNQVRLRTGPHFGGHLGYRQGGWSEPGRRAGQKRHSHAQGIGQRHQ